MINSNKLKVFTILCKKNATKMYLDIDCLKRPTCLKSSLQNGACLEAVVPLRGGTKLVVP